MKTLAALDDFIDNDSWLSALRARVSRQVSVDESHDIGHALRVALWTLRLGAGEVDQREAVAAALCHDTVNIRKDSPARQTASELSAMAACRLLPEYGFETDAIALIADAIRDHSYSRGAVPGSPLGRALQDADRLDALGAIGIMRTTSTGAQMGAKYFDPDDPWATSRKLDDHAFTVDHFFTKLLLLRDTMCTRQGRAEADRRIQTMQMFLDALAEELEIPRPGSQRSQHSQATEALACLWD